MVGDSHSIFSFHGVSANLEDFYSDFRLYVRSGKSQRCDKLTHKFAFLPSKHPIVSIDAKTNVGGTNRGTNSKIQHALQLSVRDPGQSQTVWRTLSAWNGKSSVQGPDVLIVVFFVSNMDESFSS